MCRSSPHPAHYRMNTYLGKKEPQDALTIIWQSQDMRSVALSTIQVAIQHARMTRKIQKARPASVRSGDCISASVFQLFCSPHGLFYLHAIKARSDVFNQYGNGNQDASDTKILSPAYRFHMRISVHVEILRNAAGMGLCCWPRSCHVTRSVKIPVQPMKRLRRTWQICDCTVELLESEADSPCWNKQGQVNRGSQ